MRRCVLITCHGFGEETFVEEAVLGTGDAAAEGEHQVENVVAADEVFELWEVFGVIVWVSVVLGFRVYVEGEVQN